MPKPITPAVQNELLEIQILLTELHYYRYKGSQEEAIKEIWQRLNLFIHDNDIAKDENGSFLIPKSLQPAFKEMIKQ